jgi:hypothetical protein
MASTANTLAAQVFLRSVSGRSVRELGAAPLPADLAPYLPAQGERRRALGVFERLGFKVFADTLGVSLSIEGPPELFVKVFGLQPEAVRRLKAPETVHLPPPREIGDLVEEIAIVPPPELFA